MKTAARDIQWELQTHKRPPLFFKTTFFSPPTQHQKKKKKQANMASSLRGNIDNLKRPEKKPKAKKAPQAPSSPVAASPEPKKGMVHAPLGHTPLRRIRMSNRDMPSGGCVVLNCPPLIHNAHHNTATTITPPPNTHFQSTFLKTTKAKRAQSKKQQLSFKLPLPKAIQERTNLFYSSFCGGHVQFLQGAVK